MAPGAARMEVATRNIFIARMVTQRLPSCQRLEDCLPGSFEDRNALVPQILALWRCLVVDGHAGARVFRSEGHFYSGGLSRVRTHVEVQSQPVRRIPDFDAAQLNFSPVSGAFGEAAGLLKKEFTLRILGESM